MKNKCKTCEGKKVIQKGQGNTMYFDICPNCITLKEVKKAIKQPCYKSDMQAKKIYGHDTHLAEQLKLAKKHWEKVLFPEAHKVIMENKKHEQSKK